MAFLHGTNIGGLNPAAVEAVAEFILLQHGYDDWPTNEELGGGLTGTRDDEFRAGVIDQALGWIERFPLLAPAYVEYAEAMPEYDSRSDEQIGWNAGKSFGENPDRALEEGRTLVYREVGEWKKVQG